MQPNALWLLVSIVVAGCGASSDSGVQRCGEGCAGKDEQNDFVPVNGPGSSERETVNGTYADPSAVCSGGPHRETWTRDRTVYRAVDIGDVPAESRPLHSPETVAALASLSDVEWTHLPFPYRDAPPSLVTSFSSDISTNYVKATHDMWVSLRGDVYVAGQDEVKSYVVHFDGESWQPQTLPETDDRLLVTAVSGNEEAVYLATNLGLLSSTGDGTWTWASRLDAVLPLYDVWLDASGKGAAIGQTLLLSDDNGDWQLAVRDIGLDWEVAIDGWSSVSGRNARLVLGNGSYVSRLDGTRGWTHSMLNFGLGSTVLNTHRLTQTNEGTFVGGIGSLMASTEPGLWAHYPFEFEPVSPLGQGGATVSNPRGDVYLVGFDPFVVHRFVDGSFELLPMPGRSGLAAAATNTELWVLAAAATTGEYDLHRYELDGSPESSGVFDALVPHGFVRPSFSLDDSDLMSEDELEQSVERFDPVFTRPTCVDEHLEWNDGASVRGELWEPSNPDRFRRCDASLALRDELLSDSAYSFEAPSDGTFLVRLDTDPDVSAAAYDYGPFLTVLNDCEGWLIRSARAQLHLAMKEGQTLIFQVSAVHNPPRASRPLPMRIGYTLSVY